MRALSSHCTDGEYLCNLYCHGPLSLGWSDELVVYQAVWLGVSRAVSSRKHLAWYMEIGVLGC